MRNSLWPEVLLIAALMGVLFGVVGMTKKPGCAVEAQPSVSQEPLRYIRSKVTIEDGSGGKLTLVDELSDLTSSVVQAGPRTTWVEWKNVVLGAGEYDVVIQTAAGCVARSRLEVH